MSVPPTRFGIDLGGTKIELIALDTAGRVLLRERIATPRDYRTSIGALRDLVEGAERRLGVAASVGVAMPGAVSRVTGLIKNANSTWLNGRPFVDDLAACLQRPVRVANDANCFTLSEAVDGAAADHAVVFGVILGTGVGGGIACRRTIWTGRHAIAGEWGHNGLPRVEPEDLPAPACYCGRLGCIERYLSGPALASDHRRHDSGDGSEPGPDARAIVQRARNGDAACVATLARYHRRLAKSLADVINLLDPDAIVLGGGLANIDETYDVLPGLLPEFVFSDEVDTPIVRNRHGDSSGVRGAAWLWDAASSSSPLDQLSSAPS